MDREQTWRVIEQERLRLADLLDTLADNEWDSPSLCVGWRVRDVAAHVALAPQPPALGDMLVEGIRARGSFHRLNHDISVRHADSRSSVALVTELRDRAASRRLPPVTNYRNILYDTLVHAQDIAIPLRRQHPMPSEAARAAAARVWTMGWPFWARRRLAGLRGPIDALLLLLAGRTAALDRLTGPGIPALTARLTGRPRHNRRIGGQATPTHSADDQREDT
jgi:uncharacterized protein (TIGR03083 family)